MADSKRQLIVDAWQDRLGLIAPGHEFVLPSGVHVCTTSLKPAPDNSPGIYPWRKVDFSEKQVPAIAFWDTDAQIGPGPSTQHEHRLPIGLAGYLTGGAADTEAREMLADIVACIGSDPRWGGLARWTEIEEQTIDVQQAGSVVAAVQVICTVTYRTPLWRM